MVFARMVVARAMVEALEKLDLRLSKVGAADLKEMRKVPQALEEEKKEARAGPPAYCAATGSVERDRRKTCGLEL